MVRLEAYAADADLPDPELVPQPEALRVVLLEWSSGPGCQRLPCGRERLAPCNRIDPGLPMNDRLGPGVHRSCWRLFVGHRFAAGVRHAIVDQDGLAERVTHSNKIPQMTELVELRSAPCRLRSGIAS